MGSREGQGHCGPHRRKTSPQRLVVNNSVWKQKAKVLRWDRQPGLRHRPPGEEEVQAGSDQSVGGQRRAEGVSAKTPRWASLRGCGSQWVGSLIPQPAFPPPHTQFLRVTAASTITVHTVIASFVLNRKEQTLDTYFWKWKRPAGVLQHLSP